MSMSHDLKSVCRVCGKRLGKDRQKRVTAYTCSSYKLQLQEVFEITVDSDQSGIHPASFCQLCYSVMKRQQASTQRKIPFRHSVEVFQWERHQNGCRV